MSLSRSSAVIRHLNHLYTSGTVAGASDGELLERFVATRDAIAFEALLSRHGPMVLSVCRAVLGDAQSSEDAFQATFLILVKKAHAVRVQDSLGRWLHGVSRRVAIRAGKRDALARRQFTGNPDNLASFDPEETERREVREAIHAEVHRLPTSYRDVIVACYFEGLTHEQAASRLQCPVGTVKGRLARARKILRDRLSRRGIGVATTVIATSLASSSARAAVSALLMDSTIRAAMGFAAGRAAIAGTVPAASYLLAQGALNAMTWTKIATTAALLGSLATGFASYAAIDRVAADEPRSDAPPIAAPDPTIEEDELRSQIDFLDRKAKALTTRLSQIERDHAAYESNHNSTVEELGKVRKQQHAQQTLLNAKVAARSKDRGPGHIPAGQPYTAVYSVADLVRVQEPAEINASPDGANIVFGPLIDLLQASVAPGTWKLGLLDQDPEHVGSILPFPRNASLIIRHKAEVHAQIVERLRQLRRLPRQAPDPLPKVDVRAASQEESHRKVHVNTPEVFPYLPAQPASLSKQFVERSYRIPSTVESRAQSPDGGASQASDDLIRLQNLIKIAIQPGTWGDGQGELGGDGQPLGSIVLRKTPKVITIVIVHSVEAHREIESLLNSMDLYKQLGEGESFANLTNRAPSTTRGTDPLADFPVNAPDMLRIRVPLALPGKPIDGKYLIRPDGKISLGAYGDVSVAGLKIREIKGRLVMHLAKDLSYDALGHLHRDPNDATGVEVSLAQNKSLVYYVLGSVRSPGRYPFDGKTTVLDALRACDGIPIPHSDATVRLVRAVAGRKESEATTIDIDLLNVSGPKGSNLKLQPGDRVFVYDVGVDRRASTQPGEAVRPFDEKSKETIKISDVVAPNSSDSLASSGPLPPGPEPLQPRGELELGDSGNLSAAGLTLAELGAKVATRLRSYFSDEALGIVDGDVSQATGVRLELAGRKPEVFVVEGEVPHPGEYPLQSPMTVMDAIQHCGGLTANASTSAFRLVRAPILGGTPKTLAIHVEGIMKYGDTTTNYALLPGDRLIVDKVASDVPK